MKRVLAVIVVILMVVFFVGYSFYETNRSQEHVVIQGEITAQSYSISSKVAGRIKEVFVKKGDIVKVNDKIFSISSPEVDVKLKQAEGAKDVAKAKKEQAYNGARKQEIEAAYAQYKKAKTAQRLMEKTYKRIENLYKAGVISQQKRDEVYTKYKASQLTTISAKQLYIMAKDGAREEIKKAADAQEQIYDAKVDEVNIYRDERTQYTMHAGEVSQVLLHEGELSPTGFPVVSIVDMQDSWARFAIREDYLKDFKIGKIFKLKIPAIDKEYRFKVSYIAVMGDFATWKATQSGKGFDMKSFEVDMRPLDEIKDLRVGMSVLLVK